MQASLFYKLSGRKSRENSVLPRKVSLAVFGLLCYTAVMTERGTAMDAQTRRQAIARRLRESTAPLSAAALARELSVSRQIIVGDVALLRAGGLDITATPRGYLLPRLPAGITCTFACRHRADQMGEELNAMVDQGCTVLDVIVEHPIYGQLTGLLRLSSRYDVAQFVDRCKEEAAAPLSQLTEGVHLHTVLCPDEGAAGRVREALERLGFLYQ